MEFPEDVRWSVEEAMGKVIAHVLDEYDAHREEMERLAGMPTDALLDEMNRLESEVHFTDNDLGEHDPALGRFVDQMERAIDIRKLYGREHL